MEKLEITCVNCKYEMEDEDGTHCRHCIHSAEEHFKAKEIEEIKANMDFYFDGYSQGYADAIKEFVERITLPLLTEEDISRIVDDMKGGDNNED